MQMQMKDALAGLGTVVDSQPEGLSAAGIGCHLARHQEQMAQQILVFCGGVDQPRNRLSRNYQQVGWGGRVDILDDDALIIFVNNIARNFAVDDFLEQRLGHAAFHEQMNVGRFYAMDLLRQPVGIATMRPA